MTRPLIERLQTDFSAALEDWAPFCQAPSGGVFLDVDYEDTPVKLPLPLRDARKRLVKYVTDERSAGRTDMPFNGARYYVRRIERDLRQFGERVRCSLTFGPSDYRTFLVTNGMDQRWAKRAGVGKKWKTPHQWAMQWTQGEDSLFFENSFGVNILVRARGAGGRRYLFFNQRGGQSAIGKGYTVGSVDEGLRRRFDDKLFDERSATDATPNILKAAYRGLEEEMGLARSRLGGVKPIVLSIGRVKSNWQSAALVYWPLNLSVEDVKLAAATAQDRHYEFQEMHAVRFTRKAIMEFVARQEDRAPVATWVLAMAAYALQVPEQPHVFLCHSHRDKRFVRALAGRLRANGIRVWVDEAEINVGDSLIDKIEQAIDEVDYVIAVISTASIESRWVQEELHLAMTRQIEDRRIVVLPLLKEDCNLPGFLKGKLAADCTRPHRRPREYKKLIASILDRPGR
ncbi:MAG TPA: toll/interleukin-1 receptor domain-containing protein [Thiobacillus sp.]|nr:toll/interleukin-1 receptor domain-containing protein [Thiobacillus sp.]